MFQYPSYRRLGQPHDWSGLIVSNVAGMGVGILAGSDKNDIGHIK
jgi:lipid-binding SYLF domain-containing protein